MGVSLLCVKVKPLYPGVKLPVYAHGPAEDAGMDLHAVETVLLSPNVPTLVKTGLSIELPPGYEAQIRPRSGLALKHGITVLNSPGTIDPSYRGEIGVILLWNGYNPNWTAWQATATPEPRLKVTEGDRIAQMVVSRYYSIIWQTEGDLVGTKRGDGGFGSSGL